jgi:hypothetical protein
MPLQTVDLRIRLAHSACQLPHCDPAELGGVRTAQEGQTPGVFSSCVSSVCGRSR